MYTAVVIYSKNANGYSTAQGVYAYNQKTGLYSDPVSVEDAKKAIEAYIQTNIASAGIQAGYTAYVIDRSSDAIVAVASKPPVPVAKWIDLR